MAYIRQAMKSNTDFNIDVVSIQECEDGGATCTLSLDKKALHLLAQAGFIAILTKALEDYGDN